MPTGCANIASHHATMPSTAPIECDVIDVATEQKLRTVNLPIIPRAGEEIDLDLAGRGTGDGLYVVLRVRHHVRPRKLVRADDLFGVSLYVQAVE